jgi:hypothetical protein
MNDPANVGFEAFGLVKKCQASYSFGSKTVQKIII